VTPFESLTHRQQLVLLRRLAEQALALYDLSGARLELWLHGFNTTYRVTQSDGRRFALRLNVNSSRSVEEVKGEIAWVESLSRDRAVWVPTPVPASDGEYVVLLDSKAFDRPILGTLFTWEEGRHAGKGLNPRHGRLLGQAMAALHRHAQSFIFPEGTLRNPVLDVLDGGEWRLDDKGLLPEVRDEANEALGKQAPRHVVHFDLHLHNVKVAGDRLLVIDFDDAVISTPLVDAAQTVFYLRRGPAEVEAAFWEGLGSDPVGFGSSWSELESLVAGRSVLLLNEVFRAKTADLRKYQEPYAKTVTERLERYRRTGRFSY
jgi:Ser/Thr protein kinase RdoA (MazF antagonist)